MMEEEMKRKRVESLGWLTESSIMPKKDKAIEGVGASSIVELIAQLYKTQEEAKKARDSAPDAEFHRAKKKIAPRDVFSQKNSGVESRAHRNCFIPTNCLDKLELKAVKDGSASYAALERKVELYEKLVRGELPDEEDKEKYCVDFFQKGLTQDECEQPEGNSDTSPGMPLENEAEDPHIVRLNAIPMGPGRTGLTVDNEEHKRFVMEVHEEANEAREKASALKLRRQVQAVAHRSKLKQAYLRKRLEKLKAAKIQ